MAVPRSALLILLLTGAACASRPEGPEPARSGTPILPGSENVLIRVEGGRFVQGDVFGAGRDEAPPRPVRVRDFFLSRDEITVADFRRFVEATGHVTTAEREGTALVYRFVDMDHRGWEEVEGVTWRDPGFEQADDHPVVAVSWYDAVAFTEWLARSTGRPFRLPTEAEWEYAARAGGRRIPWPWGEAPPSGERFNFADASTPWPWSVDSLDDGHARIAPVGTYPPSALGFRDLAGNVWEWCLDRFAPYGGGPTVDPRGPAEGKYRVMRGGSWINDPAAAGTTYRNWDDPAKRYVNLGFRVALPATPSSRPAGRPEP